MGMELVRGRQESESRIQDVGSPVLIAGSWILYSEKAAAGG